MTLGVHEWLALKPETKKALAQMFRISRSGVTHVVDNKIESDGYSADDLSCITVEEMRLITHLNSDSFDEQFKMVLRMIQEPELTAPIGAETLDIYGQQGTTTTKPGDSKVESSVGSGSGNKKEEGDSKAEVVAISGGSNQEHSGSTEPLPSNISVGEAVVAKQDEEVNTKKPKAVRNVRQKKSGVQEV